MQILANEYIAMKIVERIGGISIKKEWRFKFLY
jgi:hypothetical protein